MDRGAWWAKSWTWLTWLSMHTWVALRTEFTSHSSERWKSKIRVRVAGFWWELSKRQTDAFLLCPHKTRKVSEHALRFWWLILEGHYRTPPSSSHLTLITSWSLHLQTPSRWRFRASTHEFGWRVHTAQSIALHSASDAIILLGLSCTSCISPLAALLALIFW